MVFLHHRAIGLVLQGDLPLCPALKIKPILPRKGRVLAVSARLADEPCAEYASNRPFQSGSYADLPLHKCDEIVSDVITTELALLSPKTMELNSGSEAKFTIGFNPLAWTLTTKGPARSSGFFCHKHWDCQTFFR